MLSFFILHTEKPGKNNIGHASVMREHITTGWVCININPSLLSMNVASSFSDIPLIARPQAFCALVFGSSETDM